MTRTYTLKRRAEQQAQTRLRLVEAAVELHGTVGPAQTSLSMVAERAGVQRNTLYAHFPDERSLLRACSALAFERHPPPDAGAWRAHPPGRERLRAGLGDVYLWYAGAAQLLGCVLRDADHHAPTREIAELRFGPVVAGWREVLGEGLAGDQPALMRLALGYPSWRSLVMDSGLDQDGAAALMARAIAEAPGR